MERWENRYAHTRTHTAGMVEHGKKERMKTLAIILLFVLLVGMVIAGGQAIAFRDGGAEKITSRMKSESSDAVSLAVNLSRYG